MVATFILFCIRSEPPPRHSLTPVPDDASRSDRAGKFTRAIGCNRQAGSEGMFIRRRKTDALINITEDMACLVIGCGRVISILGETHKASPATGASRVARAKMLLVTKDGTHGFHRHVAAHARIGINDNLSRFLQTVFARLLAVGRVAVASSTPPSAMLVAPD